VDGEPRVECRWLFVVFEGLLPFSRNPNSFADASGEGPAEAAPSVLVRLWVSKEPFMGGDDVAEVRLDILGILVGVSLAPLLPTEFIDDARASLGSFAACDPLIATDGDPAIVGSWLRLVRSDESDCFCMELTVWDVSLDELVDRAPALVGAEAAVEDADVDVDDRRLATRCAVTDGKADICIGGSAAGIFGFFASADESV
jgi:hypothetical protein